MRVVCFFDGAAQPYNPGIGTYGYILVCPDTKKVLARGKGFVSENCSNNVAEYKACLFAAHEARKLGATRVLLRGDSQLVINQLAGEWACNKDNLRVLRDGIREILEYCDNAVYEWIPRERNSVADALSNEAYKEWCEANGRPVKYFTRPKK